MFYLLAIWYVKEGIWLRFRCTALLGVRLNIFLNVQKLFVNFFCKLLFMTFAHFQIEFLVFFLLTWKSSLLFVRINLRNVLHLSFLFGFLWYFCHWEKNRNVCSKIYLDKLQLWSNLFKWILKIKIVGGKKTSFIFFLVHWCFCVLH